MALRFQGFFPQRPNCRDWLFATGTQALVDHATTLFGLIHQPENVTITHDLRTALIGPDGRLVHLSGSNVWTPYEVQRRVREMLGPGPGSCR